MYPAARRWVPTIYETTAPTLYTIYVALNTALFDVRAFTPENGNVEIATAHYVNRHLYLPPFGGR